VSERLKGDPWVVAYDTAGAVLVVTVCARAEMEQAMSPIIRMSFFMALMWLEKLHLFLPPLLAEDGH
jgi:hypothetical protein